MRALQFDRHVEPRDVLELREVQPAPIKAGQARVRMLLSPINPSDLLRCEACTARCRPILLPQVSKG